jgi:C-terminal processing protease CtpA/Prc
MRFFGPAYDVTLRSDDGKFGLSLVGAVSTDISQASSDRGIFVRSIRDGSPADQCGKLHVHDRVLKVNNVDVTRGTQDEVVGMIRGSGKSVELTVAPFIKTKKSRKSLLVNTPT